MCDDCTFFNLTVNPIDTKVTDHAVITFSVSLPKLKAYRKLITFRNIKNLKNSDFVDNMDDRLNNVNFSQGPEDLAVVYNELFSSLFEQFCPRVEKSILVKDSCDWYDSSVVALRKQRRLLGSPSEILTAGGT